MYVTSKQQTRLHILSQAWGHTKTPARINYHVLQLLTVSWNLTLAGGGSRWRFLFFSFFFSGPGSMFFSHRVSTASFGLASFSTLGNISFFHFWKAKREGCKSAFWPSTWWYFGPEACLSNESRGADQVLTRAHVRTVKKPFPGRQY